MSLPHAQMPRLRRRSAFSRGSIHFKRDDAGWAPAMRELRDDLDATLSHYRGGLPILEARLESWVQTEAE